MQRFMNVNKINLSQLVVINVNFNKADYFGKYYIEEPTDSIFTKALNNDTEFKVLGVIKINAEEKNRLAQKGKWDVFATTGGRYNFYDIKGGTQQGNFLVANAGLQVKLMIILCLKIHSQKPNRYFCHRIYHRRPEKAD